MPDLTREQIEALADDRFQAIGELELWDKRDVTFDVMSPDPVLKALATEVLAQRERRCGTCRDWARVTTDPSDVIRAGYGWCDRGHDSYCGWTPEAGHCHDWTAKE